MRSTIILDTCLVLCNLHFIFNSQTTEKLLCDNSLSKDTFLGNLTITFAQKHNPIILDNPEWFRIFCCVDVYVYIYFFIFTIYVTLTRSWFRYNTLISLGIGSFFFQRIYYYVVLTTHPRQPSYEFLFFATELPYDINACLVMYKIITAKARPKNILKEN